MRKVVFALALLLAPSLASAQQAGPYFRLRLQASGFTPPTGYLNVYAKTSNKHLYSKDADGNEVDLTGGGSGTVTSVGMTVPSFLSVSGSPVTTSGTLAVSLATQAANLVLAGPTSGGAAAPTFRALVAADLPNTAVSAGTCTACDLTIDAQGRITAKASGAGGGGTTQTIDVINATAATGKTITAAVANSSTNKGFIFNNSTGLTGSTELAAFQSAGTTKFSLRWDANDDPTFYGSGTYSFTLKSAASTSLVFDSGTTIARPVSDVSHYLGYSTFRWLQVWSRTTVVGDTAGNKPTCDSTLRGGLFVVQAAGGASDVLQACMKAAADTYAWRDVFSAP